MVQTAGFDPSVIPAGPSEGRRQPDSEPDSARVTPVNEGEELRADPRRPDTDEAATVEPPPRVAFTAKFGPDEDGFPLQIARGEDVQAAESIDFQVISERRISQADREVLLQAQEEQSAAEEAAREASAAEAVSQFDAGAGTTVQVEQTTTSTDTAGQSDTTQRVDVEV